jgi:hypothetical protein
MEKEIKLPAGKPEPAAAYASLSTQEEDSAERRCTTYHCYDYYVGLNTAYVYCINCSLKETENDIK